MGGLHLVMSIHGLSLCGKEERRGELAGVSCGKDTNPIITYQVPTLMTFLNHNYLLIGPITKYSHMRDRGLNIAILEGGQSIALGDDFPFVPPEG